MYFDVFNGDADGICALLQLRLQHPVKSSQLITGIKRDIQLLKKLPQQTENAQITVLDISMDKNRLELNQLLSKNNQILYADHHFSGEIPENNNLTALINTESNICTSLIINQHLNHPFYAWAITGAYGDNLMHSAQQLAQQHGVAETECHALRELGTLINYNGYGAELSDLYFLPDELFKRLLYYTNPMDFIRDSESDFDTLRNGYREDIAEAENTAFYYQNDSIAVSIFPHAQWARRVSGVFGNQLANQTPERAHAILTPLKQGHGFVVSVRAPLNNKTGADELCRKFPSGGGRKAAAGINQLPEQQLDTFIRCFQEQYQN